MAKEIDIGAYSAYAIAVEHGYEGTEAEFAAQLMNSAANGALAQDGAQRAEAAAAEAAKTLASIPMDYTELSNNVSALAAEALNLESDNAAVIPNGTDFDTLMTPGNYKVQTLAQGGSMVNAPVPHSGRLTVIRTSQHDRLVQVYIANSGGGRIFWRLYDGAWSAWDVITKKSELDAVSSVVTNALSLESDNAAVIPNGTDFDTLMTPGNYKVQTLAQGESMVNAPVPHSGRLTVMRTSQHGKVLQVYVANVAAPTIYVRMNDGAWSVWEKLVTSGVTDDLTEKVAALTESSSVIPDYYDDMLTGKAQKINMELASAGADGEAFVFITDIHEKPLFTPQTMQRICRETNIRKIVNNGDVTKDKDTKEEVLPLLNKYYNLYNFPGCGLYKVVGNHEFNNGGGRDEYADRQLSADELYQTIFGGNANAVTIDPAGTLAYYFDDPAAKMRYFVCAVNYKSTVNYESINWIIAELENVPSDYDVVVFCHHGLNSAGEYTTYTSRLVGALDAYKAHASYTNDYNNETYDYTQKSGEVICMCVGDEHMDLSKISDGGIPVIATTCATSNEELGGIDRTFGTVNESAYDVYVINKNTRTINVTRIGAGSDRVFTY